MDVKSAFAKKASKPPTIAIRGLLRVYPAKSVVAVEKLTRQSDLPFRVHRCTTILKLSEPRIIRSTRCPTSRHGVAVL